MHVFDRAVLYVVWRLVNKAATMHVFEHSVF